MFQASEIMTADLVTVYADDTIDRAIALMLQYRITGLIVVDNKNQPIGILSDFDLLEVVYHVDVAGHKVSDYMTKEVVQVDITTSWTEVADLLRSKRIRRIPVTVQGKLVGLITRHDFMRIIRGTREKIKGYIENGGPKQKATAVNLQVISTHKRP